MNFKWRPRHLVRLFFLHTRYLHCLIYIEKSKSESVFLVNQIVLYLITHWFTQYRYICYWFVNVLPNPQIQQRSMAERNRMFIKFNFLNVYRFCSKQTRSWFIKPYSKKVRPMVWFFIHKRTPPPLSDPLLWTTICHRRNWSLPLGRYNQSPEWFMYEC